jgi:hypothetical protein
MDKGVRQKPHVGRGAAAFQGFETEQTSRTAISRTHHHSPWIKDRRFPPGSSSRRAAIGARRFFLISKGGVIAEYFGPRSRHLRHSFRRPFDMSLLDVMVKDRMIGSRFSVRDG